jgi:hypothetical protein
MARHRIKIESATITNQVVSDSIFDTSGNDLLNYAAWSNTITHRKLDDSVIYRYEVAESIEFFGLGYELISTVLDECEIIYIQIEIYDTGVFTLEWEGQFTRFDCTVNLDKCSVVAKVKPSKRSSIYECFFDAWERQGNIYTVTPSVTVRVSQTDAYEVLNPPCFQNVTQVGTPDPNVFCPVPAGWCADVTTVAGTSPVWTVFRSFHRQTAQGTALVPPAIGNPLDWTLLTGTTWWRCPVNDEINLGKFTNGRTLKGVIEQLLPDECDITVRSHFYGINDTHTAPPSNIAYTFANLYLQDLIIFQKSDIKRPYSDDATALSFGMKLKDLLDDLRKLKNVFWQLRDAGGGNFDLILEHISYFTTVLGADYSDLPMSLEYQYTEGVPLEETYKYMDDYSTGAFEPKPITYKCGVSKVENRLTLFSTDVEFIKDIDNASVIQDAGFVMMSCKPAPSGGEKVLIDFNNNLAYPVLHENLFRHYRKFGEGNMNGVDTTFLTVEPLKKQPPFIVETCDGPIFDPSKFYTTDLGDGYPTEAKYNIAKDLIELSLNYE